MDAAWVEQIEAQERAFAPLISEPAGVAFRRDDVGGVPVEWTTAAGGPADDGLVVVYVHGGGYSSGCARWARRAAARLALGTGGRVVAPDYRLAPRFPFPSAHEDVLAVYRALVGPLGVAPECIAVAGDSAGGGMGITLMADARDLGLPQPACAIANSLWADVALNTPSLDDPERNRHDIRRELVEMLSAIVLSTGGVDPRDPRHSPVYRDLVGVHPILLQAAGLDVCHDDSVRLAANARAAGVDVTLTEYRDVDHIWILNGACHLAYGEAYPQDPTAVGWVERGVEPPEAATAIDEMCAFIRRHVAAGRRDP